MKVYLVENRKIDNFGQIIPITSFVGSSINSCISFIRTNKDFAFRENLWWWVILEFNIDKDNLGGKWVKTYDWDSNELEGQPI